MDWGKYYVGVSKSPMRIYIGIGNIKKDGTIRSINKSDDRSFEVVNAVAKYMRIKLNSSLKKQNNKHYFGYEIPRCGKLVLVQPGYDFEVFKKKKNMITRPLRDF